MHRFKSAKPLLTKIRMPHDALCFVRPCALSLITTLAACSADTPTQAAATPSAVRQAVTGAAAAALGNDGRIQLSATPSAGGERELTAQEAVLFTDSWVRHYAPTIRSWLESTHGARLDMRSLTNCGRALYARSAFEPPPKSIPNVYRRVHGPWWLLTYCDADGLPSVSVAISAWATELSMLDGILHFPSVSGTEFVAIGIPLGQVGEYPSSPEAAILKATGQTGARVSEVPELITPLPTEGPPQLARWRVTLERPSSVHARSGDRETRELFFGPSAVGEQKTIESVASATQPSTFDLPWSPLPAPGERYKDYAARVLNRQIGKVLRRADAPVQLEPISSRED